MTATDMNDSDEAGTRQRAQEAASTAKDEGQHVAGVAKEQATQVASEAAAQAKNVLSETLTQVTGQLNEQGGAQRDKLVSTLSSLGDDLASMANSANPGLANDLNRQAADQVRSLTSRLEDREPGEILDDVRRFARQRPGTFLLGSLVAGVVAGRLLAGARDGIAGAAAATSDDGVSGSASNFGTDTSATQRFAPPSPAEAGAGPSGGLTNDPKLGVSTPGQPTQEASYGDAPETGHGPGGLTGGDRP